MLDTSGRGELESRADALDAEGDLFIYLLNYSIKVLPISKI